MCALPQSPTVESQEPVVCIARSSLPVCPTLCALVAIENQESSDLGSQWAKGQGRHPAGFGGLVLAVATPMGEAPGAGGGGTKEEKEGG